MKKTFKIFSLLLCVALLLATAASCSEDTADQSSVAASSNGTSSENTASQQEGIYFDTDIWKQVPMVSKHIIDPKNTDRVLVCGSNSGGNGANGLYLSTDGGWSWKGVMQARVCGFRDVRSQIAFDPTSYDEKIGGSAVVYWSRERNSDNGESIPALYKSTDGGETWAKLDNTEEYGGANIYCNKDGVLIIGNGNGISISSDGAKTFKKVYTGEAIFTDCVYSQPKCIFSTAKENGEFYLIQSNDLGSSWTKTALGGNSLPTYLRVSPVNTKRMAYMDDTITAAGKYPGYVYSTNDGGNSWTKATRDASLSWVPANSDNVKFAWSPTSEKTVLATWCFVCKSTDGGKSFVWNNDGYNGICVGGMFNFNVNDSNLVYIASQDYNGGFSTDGGKTWVEIYALVRKGLGRLDIRRLCY